MPSMFQRVCLPQDLEAIRFRLLSDSKTFSAPNGEQHFNSTGQTQFPGPKSPRELLQARGTWSVKPFLNLTLLIATVAWCLAIVAAPYFHSGPIYLFFSTICHQLPTRSWHFQGEQLGLCIRCTSISLGFLAGQLAIRTPNVRWLRYAIVLTAMEWLLAATVHDFELLRILSGVVLGASAAPIVRTGVVEMAVRIMRTAHEPM